jgi:hypothetical protein
MEPIEAATNITKFTASVIVPALPRSISDYGISMPCGFCAANRKPQTSECALEILAEVQQFITLIAVDHWDTPAKIGTTLVSFAHFGTSLAEWRFSRQAFHCTVEGRLRLLSSTSAAAAGFGDNVLIDH